MRRARTGAPPLLQPLNPAASASPWPAEFAKIAAVPLSPLALSPSQRLVFADPASAAAGVQRTAAAQVLAAELAARQGAGEALSLMVSTIASMVQSGRGTNSRWNAG